MAARNASQPRSTSGVYILVDRNGPVRVLMDPDITRAMPRLQLAVGRIGRILQACLVDQDLAMRVTLEPARRG